jgi:phosphate transport system substrate-binding protein
MFHKFGSDTRLPLAAAFSLSAVMAAMVTVAPSAQAQNVPCVASPNGTPSATCSQYFAGGATFPLLLNRQFFDYYGITIPLGFHIAQGQPGGINGSQPINPAGSPRNTNQQFNYCGTGSGNGRAIFTGVHATSATSASCTYATAADGAGNATAFATFPTNVAGVTPLFAGTDTPISTADYNNYIANKLATRGTPIQIPTVFGAIVVANNPVLGSLNITTVDLCSLFNGTLNLNASGQQTINGQPLSMFIRSDSSGTTTGLTTYLAAVCGPGYYITAGANVFPANTPTTFTRVNGNDGVVGAIAATTGGIGYTEASFGQPYATTTLAVPGGVLPGPGTPTPSPLIASLQNPVSGSFIFPTSTTINRDLVNVSLATLIPAHTCVLTVAGLPVVPTAGNAYPIVSTTYTLAYTRYPTTAEATAVRNVYNFVLGNRTVPFPGANDQIAGGLGFSVLTNNNTSNNAAFPLINSLRLSARSCLTTITSP